MKVMFAVHGAGRGHMTRAIALNEMLDRRGHRVAAVLVGSNQTCALPVFFEQAFSVPVYHVASPGFTLKNARAISKTGTAAHFIGHFPAFGRSLVRLHQVIKTVQPDLILNFLEPLMGFYNLLRPHRIPVLTVGHQLMIEHPQFAKVREFAVERFGMRQYVRLASARSARLALSFYPAPDIPGRRLVVCPPILRRQLFELLPGATGKHLLIYLLNHGYTPEIIRWHEKYPYISIHCFYDKPGAPAEDFYDEKLVFQRIHGDKFLSLMASCRAVACTAGFESVSEAAYLGKPLLMVPVEKDLGQYVNSRDAEQAGLGIRDSAFRLSRLLEAAPPSATARFRSWVDQAETIALRAVEATVRSGKPPPAAPPAERLNRGNTEARNH
jgi:uncharacterized protein (TIGR00661 family)